MHINGNRQKLRMVVSLKKAKTTIVLSRKWLEME